METTWTPEKIDEMIAKCKKHETNRNYARKIADAIATLNELNERVRAAYAVDAPYEELEGMWSEQTRKEMSITMMIKHFFKMVYEGDNAFVRTLKGKDYLEHYFTFKDFVNNGIYRVKIA